jgi:hypothetical protein
MPVAFDACLGYVSRRSQSSLVCRPAGTSGLSRASRIADSRSSSCSELLKRCDWTTANARRYFAFQCRRFVSPLNRSSAVHRMEPYTEGIRALARRLTAVGSFEDAARGAAEAVDSILSPSCATVATFLSNVKSPRVIAFGKRAHLVGAAFADSCIAANYPSRYGHTTFNESRPAYRDTVDGSFVFRQQTNDGRSFVVAVDACPWTKDIATRESASPGSSENDGVFSDAIISAADYWEWNSKLESRSSLAHGLFTNGNYRGNLGVLWTEPHAVSRIELEILRTASAMVELAAGGSA